MSLNPYAALSDQPRLPGSRPERRSAPQQQPSQAWTAARCHRLLRPLVSRIAALRREAAVAASISTSTASSVTPAAPVASHAGPHRRASTEESEWLMPRKKRARLTYSQRRPASRQPVESGGSRDASSGAEQRNGGPGARRTVRCLRREQQEQRRRTAPRGEIVPATPLLRRARGHIASSPPVAALTAPLGLGLPYHHHHHNNNDNNDDGDNEGSKTVAAKRAPRARKSLRALDERLSKLRAQMSPERHGDLEAIYRGLEVLLKATAASDDTGRTRARGPRSFLAMCLRKMPEYIAELEAWERWDAEQSGTVSTIDDVDTSAQIYNELESLGASKGWRHLRTLVRADGLKAVRGAISEGLFGDEFSQLLVDLCTQTGAFSEAQDLIKALVDRQYPHPVSADSSFSQLPALQPLLSLASFANKTGCTSFLFRQYSALLSSGNLPQDWLATREFERVWETAARALCSTRANIDAVTFMIEAISLLCSRKRTFTGSAETIQLEKDMLEATQRTLTSVLTILATMSLLGENETKSSSVEQVSLRRVSQMGDRLRYILKACIAGLESPTRRRTNVRVDMVYLALLLSSGRSQGNYVESRVRGSIMSIWKQHEAPKPAKNGRARNDYDNLVSLISSIARGCSRGTSVASHRCLEDLFGRLAVLDTGCHIMDSLKGAAAFLLAQQTNSVRDLIYAEKLNPPSGSENGGGNGNDSEGSQRAGGGRTLFTGYRWEETIGEWVTVSPVANKKQSATRRVLRSTSSSSSLLLMTTEKKKVVDRPASDAETLPTRPRSLIRRDTDGVADPETSQGSDVGSSVVGNERPRHGTGLGRHPTTTTTTTIKRARKRRFRASYPSSCSFPSAYHNIDDGDEDEDDSDSGESSAAEPRPGHHVLPRRTHQSRHCDDELGGGEAEAEAEADDKENRVSRTLAEAKKPRRSSGKLAVLLGTTRSRASSLSGGRTTTRGWGPYSSDDELCT